MLALASQRGKADATIAQEVTRKVTAAVAEDGSYLLVAQVGASSCDNILQGNDSLSNLQCLSQFLHCSCCSYGIRLQ